MTVVSSAAQTPATQEQKLAHQLHSEFRFPLINLESYSPNAPSCTSSSTTSLGELAHLVKLQAYLERKYAQSRLRLQRGLIAKSLFVRLTQTADTCHTILVDHLKSDHKKDFAGLYTALLDVNYSCEATKRFALLEPEVAVGKNGYNPDDKKPWAATSWLEDLPHRSREAIISFLTSIRSDPNFLASRLGKLSSAELESLAAHHQPLAAPDSVISNPRKGTPNTGSLRGLSSVSSLGTVPVASLPSPVERLLAFHRNDPLYSLLHSIFGVSNGHASLEDKRRTDIWASVCAKLLIDSKGEQFLFAVFDSWARMRNWPAKQNLEICLMGLLQEGASLLDKSDETLTSKPQQESRGKSDLLTEEFHVRAVEALFKVIDNEPGAGGIPEGVLELGSAILPKIEDPKRRRSAEMMIMVKWFFGRFLMSAIQYPEVRKIILLKTI